MKAHFFDEPELEFGGGRHIDIRFGLTTYGPLDAASDMAPKCVRLGIVGDSASIDEFVAWVDRCRLGIAPKESRLVTLYPGFPGFGNGGSFCDFIHDPQLTRTIPSHRLEQFAAIEDRNDLVRQSVDHYASEVEHLFETTSADVAVCLLSPIILKRIDISGSVRSGPRSRRRTSTSSAEHSIIWHDYLKAKCLRLKRPIQVARPGTYGGKVQRYHQDGTASREVEDEATRAWNFFTALYYKAGGVPWRLVRKASDYATCYVGVSYFYEIGNDDVQVSVAQIFNERGEGVVVRGGPAKVIKEDKTVHLTEEDSQALITRALELYKREHGNLPARAVCHKSSYFSDEEKAGFEDGIRQFDIDHWDLMSVRKSLSRFYRRKPNPPLRGTAVQLDDDHALLYTQGSIDFYRAYPGLYVPRPVEFQFDRIQRAANYLLPEALALTKMNWNSTRFVNSEPITVAASRNVGEVLRYLQSSDPIQARYSHYI